MISLANDPNDKGESAEARANDPNDKGERAEAGANDLNDKGELASATSFSRAARIFVLAAMVIEQLKIW
jgi:hypothetical protein